MNSKDINPKDINLKNMNSKNINLRKCISCGKRSNKFDFIRINKVKNRDSGFEIFVSDLGDKRYIEGRTAYLCSNLSCFNLAKKKSRLEKNLKCKIGSKIYDEIENFINKI